MIDFILLLYIGAKLDIMTWWYITLLIIKGFIIATKWSIATYNVGKDSK